MFLEDEPRRRIVRRPGLFASGGYLREHRRDGGGAVEPDDAEELRRDGRDRQHADNVSEQCGRTVKRGQEATAQRMCAEGERTHRGQSCEGAENLAKQSHRLHRSVRGWQHNPMHPASVQFGGTPDPPPIAVRAEFLLPVRRLADHDHCRRGEERDIVHPTAMPTGNASARLGTTRARASDSERGAYDDDVAHLAGPATGGLLRAEQRSDAHDRGVMSRVQGDRGDPRGWAHHRRRLRRRDRRRISFPATTLIVSLGIFHEPSQLVVLMIAVALLVVQGFVINRLAGIDYPIWAPRRQPA